jgi:hypothetical protein
MDKLDFHRMQEMLPDYAFGRLSERESKIFELNLDQNPEIKSELEEIQEVFQKVEKIDFNSMMKDRSKNISFKVQQNLRSKKNKFIDTSFFYKILVPSMAVVLMAYFIFIEDIFNNDPIINEVNIVRNEIISSSDYQALFEDIEEEDILVHIDPIGIANYNVVDNQIIDNNMDLDFLNNLELKDPEINKITYFIDANELLNSLSEDEFQILLRNIL